MGDTEHRILDLYGGKIEVTQHHYPPVGAHYMVFTPSDPRDREYRMLFETDGARVTRFRTGTAAAVAQVEGCASAGPSYRNAGRDALVGSQLTPGVRTHENHSVPWQTNSPRSGSTRS